MTVDLNGTNLGLLLKVKDVDLFNLSFLEQDISISITIAIYPTLRTKRKKKTSLFARSAACGSRVPVCAPSGTPWAVMVGVALNCLMS